MDILDFVDSNTVRTYLKSIDYRADSLSAAFIVWQSKSHTLTQKAEAYGWIINNMEDMPIPENDMMPSADSLHAFLSQYTDTLGRYIYDFESVCADAVYDYEIYYGAPEYHWVEDERIYSSFENAIESIKDSFSIDEEFGLSSPAKPILIRIMRRKLDKYDADYLYLTPELERYSYSAPLDLCDDDYGILCRFEKLCLPIPHPFQKGDIVRECAGKYALPCYYNDTLVVEDYLSVEDIERAGQILGCNDYALFGICIDEGGGEYRDSIEHYLRAELLLDCADETLLRVSRLVREGTYSLGTDG